MRKALSRDRVDLDAPIARPEFAPRRGSFDIPSSGSQYEPFVCFKVNVQWIPHIIGVMAALDQPDAWQGTSVAIEDARGEVRKIIASMESCDEVITDVRINDCILEAFVDGIWIPKGDITGCIIAVGGDTADDEYRDRPWDEPNANELPEPVDDLDCLWGGCLSLTNYVFSVSSNMADLLDTAATAADAVGDFLVVFPALGRVGVSVALGAFETMTTLTTAVLRQSLSQEAKETIACDLFCIIRSANNGNTLTTDLYEQWCDVVEQRLYTDPPTLWSVGMGLVADIARNIAGRQYAFKQFQLGLNNCEDDWIILCVDCLDDLWCYNFDFTASDGGFERIPRGISNTGFEGGLYTASVGWVASQQSDGTSPGANKTKSIAIKLAVDPESQINSIALEYTATMGTFRSGTESLRRPQVGYNGAYTYTFPDNSENGLNEITAVVDWQATSVQIRIRCSVVPVSDTTSPTGDITLTNIVLNGDGANPFGSDNC